MVFAGTFACTFERGATSSTVTRKNLHDHAITRNVLAAERKHEILARLERDGRVLVAELVAGLSVSEDTIRRDLQELTAQGLARRVHGGALVSPPEVLPFEQEDSRIRPGC